MRGLANLMDNFRHVLSISSDMRNYVVVGLIAFTIMTFTIPIVGIVSAQTHTLKVTFVNVHIHNSHDIDQGDWFLGGNVNDIEIPGTLINYDIDEDNTYNVDKSIQVTVPVDGTLRIFVSGKEFDSGGNCAFLPNVPETANTIPYVNYATTVYNGIKAACDLVPNDDDGLGIIARQFALEPKSFRWDHVPGEDQGKLIEFMKQEILRIWASPFSLGNFGGQAWTGPATIEKTDNGKTINVAGLCIIDICNRATIKLDETSNTAEMSLVTKEVITQPYRFSARQVDGLLNVFLVESYGIGWHDDVSGFNGGNDDSRQDYRLRYSIDKIS